MTSHYLTCYPLAGQLRSFLKPRWAFTFLGRFVLNTRKCLEPLFFDVVFGIHLIFFLLFIFTKYFSNLFQRALPPIYLHLIFDILKFEISSLINWIFFQVWTGFMQATQTVKIHFKLGKKSSLGVLSHTVLFGFEILI